MEEIPPENMPVGKPILTLDDVKKKQCKRNRKPKKQNPLRITFTTHSVMGMSKSKRKKRKGRNRRLSGPVLRPVGARAPSNSTQFIMDDHENSSLFVHFNRDSMLKDKENQGECDGSSPFSSDWLPYNVADFESAYQNAREDQMMNANRGDLRKAILALEAKISVVSELLSASPSRVLAHLQSQLLRLQEENVSLKQQQSLKERHAEHCHPSSSSSSTSSSSSSSSSSSTDSDSDTSSSVCSDPNCDTCIQELKKEEADDEKENACPSSEHHEEPGW